MAACHWELGELHDSSSSKSKKRTVSVLKHKTPGMETVPMLSARIMAHRKTKHHQSRAHAMCLLVDYSNR
jgi:hypothetical protein